MIMQKFCHLQFFMHKNMHVEMSYSNRFVFLKVDIDLCVKRNFVLNELLL